MPPVSERQRRFMRWAAENPKASGVPKKVSAEFNKADPGGRLPQRAGEAQPPVSERQRRFAHANRDTSAAAREKARADRPGTLPERKRRGRDWYDHPSSKG